MRRLTFQSLILTASLLAPRALLACSQCMGNSDAPIAPAVNGSILFLLGVLVVVGGSFFKFVLFLARRDGVGMEAPHSPESGTPNPSPAS
jgi:hypothetical protein